MQRINGWVGFFVFEYLVFDQIYYNIRYYVFVFSFDCYGIVGDYDVVVIDIVEYWIFFFIGYCIVEVGYGVEFVEVV